MKVKSMVKRGLKWYINKVSRNYTYLYSTGMPIIY